MDTIHKQPQLDINTDYKFIMNTNRQLTITCISRNNSYTANWLYAVGFNRNMRCISLMPWPSNAIEHMQLSTCNGVRNIQLIHHMMIFVHIHTYQNPVRQT
eukprot:614226_1